MFSVFNICTGTEKLSAGLESSIFIYKGTHLSSVMVKKMVSFFLI